MYIFSGPYVSANKVNYSLYYSTPLGLTKAQLPQNVETTIVGARLQVALRLLYYKQ